MAQAVKMTAGRALLPALVALPALALLCGLGVWQVQRLAWKEDLLARIDARIHAPPTPLPPRADWPALAAGDYEYTHVSATGVWESRYTGVAIYRPSGRFADGGSGPGYWLMEVLKLRDGGHLLVNAGMIRPDYRDDPKLIRRLSDGEVTITGLPRASEARNPFTPADNPAKNEWYTRDVAAIAAALELDDVAPFSLDRDAHPANPGMPGGGATVLSIPNDHLSYAVTWFGLAATLVGVVGVFCGRRLREARAQV